MVRAVAEAALPKCESAWRGQLRAACTHQSNCTSTSFIRPVEPSLICTADREHRKCFATRTTSSALALPSIGGDLISAVQTPSSEGVSTETRACGLTLTWKVCNARDSRARLTGMLCQRQSALPVLCQGWRRACQMPNEPATKDPPPPCRRCICAGGAARSRTGLDGFAIRCITALLPRLGHAAGKRGSLGFPFAAATGATVSGAGNESRTRDLNLGKVALYQLSYSRVSPAV